MGTPPVRKDGSLLPGSMRSQSEDVKYLSLAD
jgi:hypothetical protein